MRSPSPVPVTVLSGLPRLTVDDLSTALLLRHDRVAAVHVEPTTEHVTACVHVGAAQIHRRDYPLEHRCITCTVVTALVAELTQLAAHGGHEAVIVQLHPGLEPDSLLRRLAPALPASVRLDGHACVLGADWLEVLAGGSTLADHDAAYGPDDERFAAVALAAGIETATTLVVSSRPARPPSALADERAALDLLAPGAVRLRLRNVLDVPDSDLLGTDRFSADLLDPLAEYGLRDPNRRLADGSGLTLVRWTATRALHPLRLHAALDHLADGVIRSSGRLDVADQPTSVVGWDSAGASLLLGPIARTQLAPQRRRSRLAFLGDRLDARHIAEVLDGCVLTDAEHAIVTSTWTDLADLLPDTGTEDAA